MINISTVFRYSKSLRRARCLSICHILVVFVVAPLLIAYAEDTATVSTHLDHNNTTPSFRARVSGNGRERSITPRMLQDARRSLHV